MRLPDSDDRIVRQTSYFDRNLQRTVITSYWQSGAISIEYQYSEPAIDGYILTRIELGPKYRPSYPLRPFTR